MSQRGEGEQSVPSEEIGIHLPKMNRGDVPGRRTAWPNQRREDPAFRGHAVNFVPKGTSGEGEQTDCTSSH